MKISQVLRQLRLSKADSPAGYTLLGIEPEEYEKDQVPDLEPSILSIDAATPRKRRSTCWRWLRALKIFLPSFFSTSSAQVEPRKPRPTAWLDGVRGVAALFVVMHHMSLVWFSWEIHNGWTSSSDHLIQLPIIRLVISGPANVMIFFVVSGYALSLKPLTLIQKDQHLKMYQALSSSIFRRHPRLFVPAVIMCAPAPVITYLRGYGGGEGTPGAAIRPMNPPRFDGFGAQLGNYLKTILALSDVYSPSGLNWVYSDSLWTLPIEFKSSLVVFTLLIALSRCTARARVVITLGVAFYSLWYFHWGEFLFVGGMLVVESNLRSPRSAPSAEAGINAAEEGGGEARRVRLRRCAPLRSPGLRRLFHVAAFLASLLVLSMPEHGRGAAQSCGFQTLAGLVPAHFHASGAADYFWQPMAAVSLVLAIDGAPSLQGIFTTRPAQYLGRVSFALYLVHMLILHSLGLWLGRYFLRLTGSDSYWQYGAGIGLAAAVVGCVIIWAADLGSRFVDANAVRFTAWTYGRLCKATIGR